MGTWHLSSSGGLHSQHQTYMPWEAPCCTCCQVPTTSLLILASVLDHSFMDGLGLVGHNDSLNLVGHKGKMCAHFWYYMTCG